MSSIANLTKQTSRLWPQAVQQASRFSTTATLSHSKPGSHEEIKDEDKPKSSRIVEFQKKLRAKTPLGKLDEYTTHPFREKEPLKPWPNSVNPYTGEIGGPAGPEPTRYGDWERKGRVSDF